MTTKHISNLETPLRQILDDAHNGGLLIETDGEVRFAVIPINDDLLDVLLEQSPKLITECKKIREDVKAGRFHTLEAVKQKYSGTK